MEREEAIEFFQAHASWLKKQWSMTPEGREYEQKFLSAILALMSSKVGRDSLYWLEAMKEWIDTVPSDVVLPAMPGFDRDALDTFMKSLKPRMKEG